jgi:hypothetical protein
MILNKFVSNSIFALSIAVIALSSCKTGTTSNQNTASADSMQKDSLAQQVKNVVYPLPTPFELVQMLNNIGATYVPKALNPTSNVEKYFTQKSKAINLGVYGADVAYTVTYNNQQDTKAYLKALKKLMDEVGVKIDYSYMISDEFKQKISNKDTAVKVITNTFYDTYSYLKEQNSPEMSVMMVSGMWVELMYIATHISYDTFDNPEIAKIIFNQKDSYQKLMKLIESFNTNADVKDLETKLLPLKPIFEQAKDGLTRDQYKEVLKTIEKVRTVLIS